MLVSQILAIVTVILGAIGWLAPDFTMRVLELETNSRNTGKSEIRAASGALFIGLGGAALYYGQPLCFAMIGYAYLGAAVGRLTAVVCDSARGFIPVSFFLCEAAFAYILLSVNL